MLFRFRFFATVLLAAAFVLATTNTANSATVTVGLISKQIAPDDPAGEWELWAWTSSGDNDGIQSVSIELFGENNNGFMTMPLLATSSTPIIGFVLGNRDTPNSSTGNVLFASQPNLGLPIQWVYGVGSPDIPEQIDPPPPSPLFMQQWDWWQNPAFTSSQLGTNPINIPQGSILVAEGITSNYTAVNVNDQFSLLDIDVWSEGEAASNGNAIETAQTIILRDYVASVPEPGALFLAGLLMMSTMFYSYIY